ncbi:CRISPR-associated endonuclease Cas2 [Rhodanobacter sp. BL-MT-08]
MMILVTYDVSTMDAGSQRRLRRVAKACRDYGQRVQFSVFEIEIESGSWVMLKQRLIDVINPQIDSLRFYYLGTHWERKVEHIGAKPALDLKGPLVF